MTTVRRGTSPSHLGPMMLSSNITGDLNARHVTAHYELLDGTPVRGSVKFTASVVLRDANSDLILMPETFTATLDATGSIDILLPVTDDPDISPTGWTYSVTESFTNTTGRQPYAISVPYDAGNDAPLSLWSLTADASAGIPAISIAAVSQPVDLTIYQGDDFSFPFKIRDADGYKDLTDYVPESQIRVSDGAPDVLVAFTAVIADQAVSPGLVTLSLTGVQTAALAVTAAGAPYVWDVQLTDPNGLVKTYLFGTVTVLPQVTQ